MLFTMLQKSQNRTKYPCDSFREVGSHINDIYIFYFLIIFVNVYIYILGVAKTYLQGTVGGARRRGDNGGRGQKTADRAGAEVFSDAFVSLLNV